MKCKSGFSKENLETYEVDGIKYRKSNHRMIYNPEFHENHGKRWSEEDKAYLVQMRPAMKWAYLSLALGRTHDVCADKYYELKKQGKLEYYKNLEA